MIEEEKKKMREARKLCMKEAISTKDDSGSNRKEKERLREEKEQGRGLQKKKRKSPHEHTSDAYAPRDNSIKQAFMSSRTCSHFVEDRVIKKERES